MLKLKSLYQSITLLAMLSKLKSWLYTHFSDRRILICDACGTARIYNWKVIDGVEVDFRYDSSKTIVASSFSDFAKYINAQTTATNIEEFLAPNTTN